MALLRDVRTRRRIVARGAVRAARAFALAGALAALALSSGACGGGARDSATADTAVLQGARPDTASTARTDTAAGPLSPVGDSAARAPSGPTFVLRVDSAAGDTVYRASGCQSCHGARGEGVSGLGPSLADSTWLHGDGSVAFVQRVTLEGIAEPKTTLRGMPAYASRMTPAQAERVAAYVVSLARPDLVVDAVPDSTPDSTPGGAAEAAPPP